MKVSVEMDSNSAMFKLIQLTESLSLERQINILNFAQGVVVGAEIDRKKEKKEGAA